MDENASQSLLMVGGILIAISVLSFFVYAISTFGGFANNMNSQIEGSEIQKYNQHFLQYDSRCNIAFQDVISTINFVKDWNDKNDYSFKQVSDVSVEYATNVYIIDSNKKTIKVFGDNNWIKEDVYADNQKVKDVLNKKLADPQYADYYYAVNVQTITIEPHLDKNYYVLNTTYGPSQATRKTDIDINPHTGFIQNIYFTAVAKGNYINLDYTVKNKDYFKMTELGD